MKKSLMYLAMLGLLTSGLASAKEYSAVMEINAVVNPKVMTCSVIPSDSSISLLELPETLIKQGDDATKPVVVHLSVVGAEECDQMISQGRMAYRFTGVSDEAGGTALANSLSDSSAAKGVAIGIFDGSNKPIALNSGLLPAKDDTIFGLQMVQLKGQEAVGGNINTSVTIDIVRL
jgi:type 1 fimbria pilin